MKYSWKRALLASVAALAAAALIDSAPAAAQDNNTLRVGVYSKAPTRGNPYGGGGVPSIYWWDALFDGLTRVNKEGQVVPWLAESWKLVDDKTWHFKLKPNLEFSNGAKIDADAVVAHFAWALSDEGRATSGGRELREFDRVTKVDNLTVAIHTKAPAPLTPGTLQRAYILDPKHLKDAGLPGYTANPVTSGGYRVVRWTDSEAEYTVFDKSWRAGKIRTLRLIELPEAAARLQAIVSKQIDLAITVSPDDIKAVRDAGQVVHVYGAPNIMNFVMFTKDFHGRWGQKGTPFADKRVRMAANMAIDRQGIVDGLLGGVTAPANQPSNPQTFGFNAALPQYKYDPPAAKKMLADAGYPNGFKMVAQFIPGAIPRDIEIYSFMAESLGRIGIQAEVQQIPFADWLRRYLNGQWESDGSGFSAFVDPHMDASRPFTNFSCLTPNAIICIQGHMPLITAAATEMDAKKREKILQDLMAAAHNDAMSMPLLYGVDIYAATPRLRNFEYWNRVLQWERMTLEGQG